MKTKTKPTLRARRMCANYYGDFVAFHNTRSSAMREGDHREQFIAVPVAVIPLDDLYALGDSMVAALTAIGVLLRTRKGGAK